MSEPNKYHSFSALDIERYRQGQMTPVEQHALEMAALEDPFLADALEGYAYTATPQADLESLRERLEQKTRKNRLIPIYRTNQFWMKIAALFVVVAGAGYLVSRTFRNDPVNMARVNEKDANNYKAPEFKEKKDSLIPLNRTNENSETVSTYHLTVPADSVKTGNNISANLKSNTDTGTYAITATEPAADSKKYSDVTANLNSKNSNVVVFQNGTVNNSSTGNIQTTNSNISPSPDANSNTWRQVQKQNQSTARTQAPATVNNSVAFLENKDKADKKKDTIILTDSTTNLSIVLTPLPEDKNLKEIVVQDSEAMKKRSAKVVSKPIVIIDSLEPAEGRASFDEYVVSHLRSPDEISNKLESGGEVELAFDVDSKGQAINISVTRSLCEKCDEEAIRLLREGPKWKKKKNRKGKITIRF